MKTLKALSALLTYPSPELCAAAGEIRQVLMEAPALPEEARMALAPLLDSLERDDLYDLQECYVFLFDRTRSLSLHLFEHVHGESRDRGQAMIDLAEVYARNGFAIAARELPDYLPLFLEFASTLPDQEAIDLLGDTAHVLAALAERAEKRETPYAAVFRALTAIAAEPDPLALDALCGEEEPDPDDLAALDAAWEEEQVVFGPGASDACGQDSLMAKMRAARRPAPDITAPPARPRTVVTYTPSSEG
jgi:nitrate reductase molybdenum cofactor assembly chaperone NarJ/NarW